MGNEPQTAAEPITPYDFENDPSPIAVRSRHDRDLAKITAAEIITAARRDGGRDVGALLLLEQVVTHVFMELVPPAGRTRALELFMSNMASRIARAGLEAK